LPFFRKPLSLRIGAFCFYFCAPSPLKKFLNIPLVIICLSASKSVLAQDSLTGTRNVLVETTDLYGMESQCWAPLSDSSVKNVKLLPTFLRGGLASPYSVTQVPTLIVPGFKIGLNPFDLFGFQPDSIRFFNARTPYTNLQLLISSRKEQYFELLHTQNVTKRWNAAIHLLRTNSDGFYQRQTAVSNNLSVTSHYRSKGGRYGFAITGLALNFKKDENGGIANDSILESNILSNKRLFGVELNEARSRRGTQGLQIIHYWYLGKLSSQAGGDSSAWTPRSFIAANTSIKRSWFVYSDKDPVSGFYPVTYLDTLSTLDSTHVFQLENSITWRTLNNGGKLNPINTELGIRHNYTEVVMAGTDTTFSDLILEGRVFSKPGPGAGRLTWWLKGHYFFNGEHAGEYLTDARVNYRTGGRYTGQATIGVSTAYSSPEFALTYYRSNNFWWYNSFERIASYRYEAGYVMPGLRLSIKMQALIQQNFVYLDSNCLPQQMKEALTIMSGVLRKDINLQHWNFNTSLVFQSSSDPGVFPVPGLALEHSIFYSGFWFKGVMEVAIGADVYYFTSYYANAYMPALGLFYNQGETRIGNYPFADAFFNFKIKRARVFLRADHFASGFMGNRYYVAPHYPANDRQLRVGLSWKFFD
jgi:hypothetical protein